MSIKELGRLLFVYFFLALVFSMIRISGDSFPIATGSVLSEIESVNGAKELYTGEQFREIHDGERVTSKVPLLEKDKIENGVLCFYTYNGIVNVMFEDQLLYSYGKDIDDRGAMIGVVYVQVPIPEAAWGKELIVTIDACEESAFSTAPAFSVYRGDEAYKYFLDKKLVSLMIVLFLFVGCGMALVLLVNFRNVRGFRKTIVALILLLFDCSLFVFTYSGVYRIFWSGYAWALAEYISYMLIPLLFVLFYYQWGMERNEKKVHITLIRFLLYFWSIACLVVTVLHFTNILHYSRLTNFGNAGILVIIVCSFYISFSRRRQKADQWVLYGMAQLLLWVSLDMLRYYLVRQFQMYFLQEILYLTAIGMLAFMTSITCAIYTHIAEKAEQVRKAENEIRHLERELNNSYLSGMLSQIQPHFLYNSLSSIRTIIRSDPDRAYDLLYDFTIYLRSSLSLLSSQDMISFDAELKNINSYLNIEKMRLGDRLLILQDIRSRAFTIPPLSIQPLVENAVKHGIFPKGKQGGYVKLETEERENEYWICVSDNGVGFEVDTIRHKKESVALVNLVYRLENLYGGTVEINSTPGEGTYVTVIIPKKVKNE